MPERSGTTNSGKKEERQYRQVLDKAVKEGKYEADGAAKQTDARTTPKRSPARLTPVVPRMKSESCSRRSSPTSTRTGRRSTKKSGSPRASAALKLLSARANACIRNT